MLLPLDVANELLQLSDLRIEYLLEELRGEFLGDGEFIGSFHRLVEVSSKPANRGLAHTCDRGLSFHGEP